MSLPIYFDEDSQDSELIRILRARGLTVTTVNEQGMQRRADEEQLVFATEKGWTLFSFNVEHFCRLHAAWLKAGKEHAGLIVAYQQRFHLGELAARIVHLNHDLASEQMRNRLEFLSNW